jgi:drug/metabolite transporter (DMT)-like permease
MTDMSKIPGHIYLWLAVLIFGASSSVTRKLTEIGASQFVHGHNPISFCNVLFVGNLCALGIMLIICRSQLTSANLRSISKFEWGSLLMVALLASAIAPAAIFQALALSPVNNIILLGRLEVPLLLILSKVFLQERLHRNQIIGAAVILTGIVIALTDSQSEGGWASFRIGTGEILTIIAAVCLSIANLVSKTNLSQVPLGIHSIARTGIGSIVFFGLAVSLYGPDHFMESFSPFLWQWMLFYGAVIVVAGQFCWLQGLKLSSIATAAIISCFHPIAGVFFAYLILAEVPTSAQVAGGSILLVGLLISQLRGDRQQQSSSMTPKPLIDNSFKGF